LSGFDFFPLTNFWSVADDFSRAFAVFGGSELPSEPAIPSAEGNQSMKSASAQTESAGLLQ